MFKGKWSAEDDGYWDNLGCAWWDEYINKMNKDVTINDLRNLDDGHIYKAIFREIEAECPTIEAVAVYCLNAIDSRYYNYMIADRYQPEAYRIFDEMYDGGFLEDRTYITKDIERNGGNPSDYETNPEIYETVYHHHFENILIKLGIQY